MDINYSLLLSLLFFFLLHHSHVNDIRLCYRKHCTNVQRKALLDFREALTDPSIRLSAWLRKTVANWKESTATTKRDKLAGSILEICTSSSMVEQVIQICIRNLVLEVGSILLCFSFTTLAILILV